MTESANSPQGVIAIMTKPDGRIIASEADFERSGYGGFKLWEAQKMRARDAVKRAAVRAYCSNVVCDALGGYEFDQISDCLLSKGKHQLTYKAIGYADDIADSIER